MNKHRGSSFDDWYEENVARKWWEMQRRRAVVDKMIYYGGFKVGQDRSVFKEELQQLEDVYEDVIEQTEKELRDTLPAMLNCIRQFVALHDGMEKVKNRLDDLRYKRGDEDDEEMEDEDE